MNSLLDSLQKSMGSLFRHNLILLLVFVLVTVLLRYPSFNQIVIDHDESTYLVIAQKWLQGEVLYQDLIDIKPVGIYLFFGMFQYLGFTSIFMIRLLSSMFLGIGVFYLVRMVQSFTKTNFAALVSGLVFLVFHLSMFSFPVNTETYFTTLVLIGISILVINRDKLNWSISLFGGLLLGLAFITKYLALFDGLAIGVFLLITQANHLKIKTALFITLGFVLPFLVTNTCFYLFDNYDAFYFVTFEAPFQYKSTSENSFFAPFNHIIKFFWSYIILFPVMFVSIKKESLFSFIWLFLAFIAVLLPQKPFEHYWIQLFAPVSLIFGFIVHSLVEIGDRKFDFKAVRLAKIFVGLLLLVVLIGKFSQGYKSFSSKDSNIEILDYLSENVKEDETIFCGNYEQIIYYLLDKPTLTPYVHKSILYTKTHQKTLNILEKEELGKIISKKPDYITIRNKYPVEWFDSYVIENYNLEKEFGEIKVYHLK